MQNKKRLIIGALSANSYEGRRRGCLATWADLRDYNDVDVVFLVGDPEAKLPTRNGHILYCPCPDDGASLPQKTRWFCLWALERFDFDYLFKCDDDTYVHINRLLNLGSTAEYVGRDIVSNNPSLGSYASGGGGYRISRRAAVCIGERLLESQGPEDVLARDALRHVEIGLTNEDRFSPWNHIWPTTTNEIITSHHCSPEQMTNIHRELARMPAE